MEFFTAHQGQEAARKGYKIQKKSGANHYFNMNDHREREPIKSSPLFNTISSNIAQKHRLLKLD